MYSVRDNLGTEPVLDEDENPVTDEEGNEVTAPVYATLYKTCTVTENSNSVTVYFDIPVDNPQEGSNDEKLNHSVEKGLYNQRLGVEDTHQAGAGSNNTSDYLENYFEDGAQTSFISTSAIVSNPKAKNSDGEELVFDGWYILNGTNSENYSLTKLSSDNSLALS